jgi:radical SAM superfamily enzyme YgiQ (UPF0313 family)
MIDNALDVKWGCTARYDNLDKEILSLMKKADCYGLYLGLESGSNRVLESINKKETIERNIEISKMIYDSGIIQATSILLGSPEEQKEDIEETLKVMKNLKTDFFDVNSYMPLPGTPFYDAMTEQERQAIDWSKVGLKSYGNYFSRHMTKSELESYQNQAYEIANSKRKKSIIKLVFKRVIESITKPFKK